MTRLLPLLCLFLPVIGAAAEPPKTGKPGVFPAEKLTVNGTDRVFRLIVPESMDLTQPAPCVIAFHGMGIDSKDLMPRYTKLDELAREKKFILVFPEAVGRSWGLAPAKVQADLACFDALLAEIQSRYQIDSQRIFIIGMSNGGYFAHLVGKERSKTIAAVCSHSGPLGLQTLGGIKAERKFPVLIIHGEQDRLLSVVFARENRDKYTREKHEVKYVEVPRLGHFWAHQVNINETIWEFFASHPLKQ